MRKFQHVCSMTLLVLTGLAMITAVILGVTRDVLSGLALDLDSLWVVLMIYGSYPLFMLLLLWPQQKSTAECWILLLGWLLFFSVMVYSWSMVFVVDPGSIPALVMVWYGMLQTMVIAGLFILLALIRMWRYRHAEVME